MGKRRRQKPPTARIYRHGRKWRTKFWIAGEIFQIAIADIADCSEDEALKLAQQAISDTFRKATRRRSPRTQGFLFERYLESKADRSQSHRENVLRFAERFHEWVGLNFTAKRFDFRRLSRHDIEEFRDWLLHEAPRKEKYKKEEKGLSPKTVKEHIDFISGFYRWSELPNPCLHVRRPRKSEEDRQDHLEYFTAEELQKLVTVCASRYPAFLNGLLVFIHTGCRAAEIQGLQRSDMDYERQAIRVVGKGKKPRLLTLSGPMQQAWDALEHQLGYDSRTDGFVFPQYSGWARKRLEIIGKSALGSEVRCNPHKFRHTWATQALSGWDDPWDIAAVAEWLGHKNVSVTFAVYKHLIPKTPKSGYSLAVPTK